MPPPAESQTTIVPDAFDGLDAQLIDDLCRVGLMRRGSDAAGTGALVVQKQLLLFEKLLTNYRLRLVPRQSTVRGFQFCTGILYGARAASEGRPSLERPIPAGGQAEELSDAALACLGEMAERLSLFKDSKEDARVFERSSVLKTVSPAAFLGLSQNQEEALLNRANPASKRDEKIDWAGLSDQYVWLKNIVSNDEIQLQAYAALFGERACLFDLPISFASSTGCAVWKTQKGARERALLELVERDVIAQMWYNRMGIKRLNLQAVKKLLTLQFFESLEARKRHWSIYLGNAELSVQVAFAISCEEDGSRTAFGSCAAFSVQKAVRGALKEMLQSENELDQIEKSYASVEDVQKIPKQLAFARTKSIFDELPLKDAPSATEDELSKTYSYDALIESCTGQGISLWEFDATHPDLQIPCVKLFSPELCTWEPRLGKPRLYQNAVTQGLRDTPITENGAKERPFPF